MSITRLEIKLQTPNPMFIKWVERWLLEAETRNAISQFKLRKALQALRSYPLPLYSGRDCAVLRGFGPTLCKLIDEELLLQRTAATNPQSTISSAYNNDSYQSDVQQVVETVDRIARKAKLKKTKKTEEKPNKITKKAQHLLDLEEQRTCQVTMREGTFHIELLVDIQETNGKNKLFLDKTRSYLQTLAVPHEVRRLTVGDFLWIARDHDGNELVLPYIIERKRMDDLASSIRDGRFSEQKHRLKQCGIQNVIYLIEDYGNNEHLGLPLENLMQALTNTQIHNDFIIVRTENHYRSMLYLQSMTQLLIQMYKNKMLVSMPKEQLQQSQPKDGIVRLLKFRALYEDSARSAQLSVREVFVQQLLQLHSLSLDRALALVNKYSTPRQLLDAYDACASESEASLLLAGITCGQLQRPLGEKISQCLYKFYRTEFS